MILDAWPRGERLGERLPVPLESLDNPARGRSLDACDVVRLVCGTPLTGRSTFTFANAATYQFEQRPLPAPGDLDDEGVCLCGCGYDARVIAAEREVFERALRELSPRTAILLPDGSVEMRETP